MARTEPITAPGSQSTKKSVIKLMTLLATGAFTLATSYVLADSHEPETIEGMHHSNMDMSTPWGQMRGAMDTTMQAMPSEVSGDVDADFLLMMIPHHQSAIDKAPVELEHGEEEETHALAQ